MTANGSSSMFFARLAALAVALLLVSACDRNVEPFDPNEKPSQPDLSKIFPDGGASPTASDAPPSPSGGRGAPPVAAAGPPVRGTLRLGPNAEGRVPPGAVLFIIARGGPGPPIAVKRIAQPKFPLEFEVGPDDRMIQAMPFQGPFQLTARVDADGNATSRTPGDLAGAATAPANPGDSGIEIVIDEVL